MKILSKSKQKFHEQCNSWKLRENKIFAENSFRIHLTFFELIKSCNFHIFYQQQANRVFFFAPWYFFLFIYYNCIFVQFLFFFKMLFPQKCPTLTSQRRPTEKFFNYKLSLGNDFVQLSFRTLVSVPCTQNFFISVDFSHSTWEKGEKVFRFNN